ncbi:MAG: bifunctional phosphoribosyl-AMP cyclohydrolase/phosphoribosyl-ATP diphosphatase HisIE [Candidatus Izemoplasmataceae bacterium]
METIDKNILETIEFDEKGLVPAVVQSVDDNQVLMLAYMNKEALEKTLKTKKGTYFSRSRGTLWVKGETSGNTQEVKEAYYDCDADSILLKVRQTGVACHKNRMSCFHNPLGETGTAASSSREIIEEVYSVVRERKNKPVEGSYTTYLFNEGIDKILKKVGEESSEVIIASKNHSKSEMVEEISDLVYHTLVLMANEGVTPGDVSEALKKRRPSDD